MRPAFQAFAIMALLASALAGCGYREVKAPCSPDEGQPSILTSYAPVSRQAPPFDRLAAGGSLPDPCGPMRKVNETPQ
jgi:hypothetical protein